jgi:hypothetical protein
VQAAALVVAAAVVVVGALLVAGVIPGLYSSHSGGGSSPTYLLTFTESGLPNGSRWSVTLGGASSSSTNSTIVFGESNGSYGFSVGSPAGYTSSPANGSLEVSGSPVDTPVRMEALPPTYPVTFTAMGLPAGAGWAVDVAAADTPPVAEPPVLVLETGSIIGFALTNGTYSFFTDSMTSNYTGEPSYGTFNVSGEPVNRTVVFSAPSGYAVTFTATGLPVGTSWTVTLNSSSQTSTGSTVTFIEPNGSYPFFVITKDYAANPAFGTATIAGAPVTQAIAFSRLPVTYSVTFNATGLAAGAAWAVSLYSESTSENQTIGEVGTSAIEFGGIANGSYEFWVNASGYAPVPSSGMLVVDGKSVTEAIQFGPPSPPGYTVTVAETGLSPGTEWLASFGSLRDSVNGTGSSAVTFSTPNGTYGWSGYAAGYEGTPRSGVVTVDGSSVRVLVTFTPLAPGTYLVLVEPLLTEYAGSASTDWSVDVAGEIQPVLGSLPVTFVEPNGSISWTITAPAGYGIEAGAGTIEIQGGFTVASSATTLGAAIAFGFMPPPAGQPPGVPPPSLGPLTYSCSIGSNPSRLAQIEQVTGPVQSGQTTCIPLPSLRPE